MDALAWVCLIAIVLGWWIVLIGGYLLNSMFFRLGLESWVAVRLGYTIGAVLSWVWALRTPWPVTTFAPVPDAAVAGLPVWTYPAVACAPGALAIFIAWVVQPERVGHTAA